MTLTAANCLFLAGFVIQSLVLIRGIRQKKDAIGFLTSIGFALVVVVLNGETQEGGLMLGFCLGYAIAFAGIFKRRLLHPIGPELLLFWSLLFVYVTYEANERTFIIAGTVMLALNVFGLSRRVTAVAAVRTYFYVAYLLLVCGVAYFGSTIVQASTTELLYAHNLSADSLLLAFIAGMAMMNIAINLAYVYELIPSRSHSIADIRKSAGELAAQYRPLHSTSPLALLGVIIIAVVLALNTSFHFIGNNLLLPLAILASSLLIPVPGKPARSSDRS